MSHLCPKCGEASWVCPHLQNFSPIVGAEATEASLSSIIRDTDGTEATISLEDVVFCISMSTLDEFKRDLSALLNKHRI